MPNAAIHPTPQELTAFVLGKLSDSGAAAVARHLETCPACRQAIEKLPADSFVGKVRAARPSVSSLATPTSGTTNLSGTAAVASPAPTDLPPDLANYNKYRFVRELGRGGMGVVYQAEQTIMGRTVAVKVINPSVLDHPDALPRFQSEVRAAAKLDHPNIVRAHDAEQVGSMHLLVMEYVEGTSLAELVAKKGPLSVPYACHYVRQAALGLQHAFEQGMVHRDIKPQNLMVNARGQVKVLDFGLARMRSERKTGGGLTQVDAFMGTPEYVSPEQATDARSADTRADIYSLGCTLFFLLTGRPPFQEDTLVKLVLAQIEKDPPLLRDVRADVPAALSALVARMLPKDPGQRFQTPIEVAQALAAFVKAGTKPAAGVSSPASGVSAPATGTMVAADTSQIKAILREVPGKTPSAETPAKETASAFAGLGEEVASVKKKAKPARKTAKPAPEAWYQRWPVLAGAGAAVLALGLGAWLLAGIVFKTKVKTADGEAFVVLEIDQSDAEVTVDGQRINVRVAGDNKPIEIKVEPGRHKLRISKAGFVVRTQDIELKTGKSPPIKIRLEREPTKPGDKGDVKWIQEVAALPADSQVKAVTDKLKERNPGFDGKVKPTIENGVVTGLNFVTDHVTDISPLRALRGLKLLWCRGSGAKKGKLADLAPLEGMSLTSLNLWGNPEIRTLAPLQGMPLTWLDIAFARLVNDLSPLKGMKLTCLNCYGCASITDLAPLQGMPLTHLEIVGAQQINDLSLLKDMPLMELNCAFTQVSDLSPLKDMPLMELNFHGTRVSDLSLLKGMKLTLLQCTDTQVADLSPLKGMKLTCLGCKGTQVSDLSVLKGMPLKEVWCDFRPERDTEILRSIKSLEKINGKPAAQFWKEVGGTKTSDRLPLEKKWIQEVAALPAESQVKAVADKLKERNPGFDGAVKPTIENGNVTGLQFGTDHVTDISPLRALSGLKFLACKGSGPGKGKLADLSPLKGIQLTWLDCARTKVSDLSPLKGLQLSGLNLAGTNVSDLSPLKDTKLTWLDCQGTRVSDLSPLKSLPLTLLNCNGTKVSELSPLKDTKLTFLDCQRTGVSDLSPLKGLPLTVLRCNGTKVSDLSPLQGMPLSVLLVDGPRVTDLTPIRDLPLTELKCDFKPERDTEILRSIKTLKKINDKPAAQFWKEMDGKKP